MFSLVDGLPCFAEELYTRFNYYSYRVDCVNRDAAVLVVPKLRQALDKLTGATLKLASYEVSSEVGKSHVHALLEVRLGPKQKSRTPVESALRGYVELWPVDKMGKFLSSKLSLLHIINTVCYLIKDGDVLYNQTGVEVEELQKLCTKDARKDRSEKESTCVVEDVFKLVEADISMTGLSITRIEWLIPRIVTAIDKVYSDNGKRLLGAYPMEGLVRTVLYKFAPTETSHHMSNKMIDRIIFR